MPSPDYVIKTGDSGMSLTAVLEDATGTPVSISGATVRFLMRPIDLSTVTVNAAATNNESGASTYGHVAYAWPASGATIAAGHYLAEWQVSYPSGATVTYPNGGYTHIQIVGQISS